MLAGQFSDYLQTMIAKHVTFEIRDYGDNCYVISCFDGCSHSAGKNKFDVIDKILPLEGLMPSLLNDSGFLQKKISLLY